MADDGTSDRIQDRRRTRRSNSITRDIGLVAEEIRTSKLKHFGNLLERTAD